MILHEAPSELLSKKASLTFKALADFKALYSISNNEDIITFIQQKTMSTDCCLISLDVQTQAISNVAWRHWTEEVFYLIIHCLEAHNCNPLVIIAEMLGLVKIRLKQNYF